MEFLLAIVLGHCSYLPNGSGYLFPAGSSSLFPASLLPSSHNRDSRVCLWLSADSLGKALNSSQHLSEPLDSPLVHSCLFLLRVLRADPRAWYMPGPCSTAEPHSQNPQTRSDFKVGQVV